MIVARGQLWESIGGPEFQVIEVVDIDNKTWVYYRNTLNGQEHSCYEESFVARFSPVVNRHQSGDKK